MNIRHRHLFLAAAGDGGGGGTGDELVEVDIAGGVKIKLPKADAEKAIAARDAAKTALREAQERAGKHEADRNAADAARLKAEEDRAAAEHAKKGEIDQLRTLLTKGATEREAKISSTLRDKALIAAVRGVDRIVPGAVEDIVDQLRGRSRYDIDSDAVVVLDSAGQPLKDTSGKPVAVDAYIGEWLGKRPHYLLDGTPQGTGGEGGKKPVVGKIMTEAQAAGMSPLELAKHLQANPGSKIVG